MTEGNRLGSEVSVMSVATQGITQKHMILSGKKEGGGGRGGRGVVQGNKSSACIRDRW